MILRTLIFFPLLAALVITCLILFRSQIGSMLIGLLRWSRHLHRRTRRGGGGWRNYAVRGLIVLLGGVVLLVGIPLVPLPGPGWLTIAAGLGLLSFEFKWARNLLGALREGFLWVYRYARSLRRVEQLLRHLNLDPPPEDSLWNELSSEQDPLS